MSDNESYLIKIEQIVSKKEEAIVRLDAMIEERQKKINFLKSGEEEAARNYSIFLNKIRQESELAVLQENEKVKNAQEFCGVSLGKIATAEKTFEEQRQKLEKMTLAINQKKLDLANENLCLERILSLIIQNTSEVKEHHKQVVLDLNRNSIKETNIHMSLKLLDEKEAQFAKSIEKTQTLLNEKEKELDGKLAELKMKEVELSEVQASIRKEQKQLDLDKKRLHSLVKMARGV